jgi:hypothetical protein
MAFVPRLSPCKDDQEGADDWSRYEQLGFPRQWIDMRKATGGLWIAPDEYFWTPDSFFTAVKGMTPALLGEIREKTGGCFFKMKLVDQCEFIGASLIRMTRAELGGADHFLSGNYKRALEHAALAYFAKAGWRGDPCEGASFDVALHLVRCWFVDHGVEFVPKDVMQYRKGSRTINAEQRTALGAAISAITEADLVEAFETAQRLKGQPPPNYNEHYFEARKAGRTPKPFLTLPPGSADMRVDHLLEGWKAIGPDRLAQACERWMDGYGGAGWPDLTLHKDGLMRLVEVKGGSDKFTHRQTSFIRNIARPLGWSVEVLHVKNG